MITDEQLAKLEALEKAASPGPFSFNRLGVVDANKNPVADEDEMEWDNLQFLVAMRNALPELIADYRRMQHELAFLHKHVNVTELIRWVTSNDD